MPFPEWFGSGQNEAAFLRRVSTTCPTAWSPSTPTGGWC